MNTYQAKIGYARTSTVDQNLDAQMRALFFQPRNDGLKILH